MWRTEAQHLAGDGSSVAFIPGSPPAMSSDISGLEGLQSANLIPCSATLYLMTLDKPLSLTLLIHKIGNNIISPLRAEH